MKVNDIIPQFNVDKFIQQLIAKTNPSNYPKNSISIRESIFKMEIDDVKKAQQICNDLNKEVTETLLNFHKKHIKDK